MRIDHRADYRRERIKQYPTTGDQLDALWKIVASLASTGQLTPDGRAMLDRIKAVKEGNPKV